MSARPLLFPFLFQLFYCTFFKDYDQYGETIKVKIVIKIKIMMKMVKRTVNLVDYEYVKYQTGWWWSSMIRNSAEHVRPICDQWLRMMEDRWLTTSHDVTFIHHHLWWWWWWGWWWLDRQPMVNNMTWHDFLYSSSGFFFLSILHWYPYHNMIITCLLTDAILEIIISITKE